MAKSRIKHPFKGTQIPLPIDGAEPAIGFEEPPTAKPMTTAKPTSKSPWVSTTALAQELGCAAKHIRNTLKDDVFRQGRKRGEYFVLNPHAWRPTYRWHLGRCIKRLDDLEGGDGPKGPVFGDRVG